MARIIRECKELPGQQLFEYLEHNKRQIVTSDDVNAYLKEISGADITAKDFRTWYGTLIAGQILNEQGITDTVKDKKKNITAAVRETSRYLRNTPATARAYYIHPAVFAAYLDGWVIGTIARHPRYRDHHADEGLREPEKLVLNMIHLYQ